MGKSHDEYNGLVPRKVAITTCVFGMIELLVAIIVIICAFVLFGGFCDQFDCEGFSKALGLWLGFPLVIPALLAVVVMGTRHTQALAAFGITNVVVLILAIVHTVMVYQDDTDYWSKYTGAYDSNQCTPVFPTKCSCRIGASDNLIPYGCDLIQFGSDLNWVLFAFSIVSIVATCFSVILSIIGYNLTESKPRNN